MYICEICGYETKRKWSFDYHNNRVNKCKPKSESHIDRNIDRNSEVSEISALKGEECKLCIEVDVPNTCIKCQKRLSSKSALTKHSKNCKGVKTIHCPICLKIFASKESKYQHKKNVKCKPPIDVPETVQEENERLKKEAKLMSEEIETLKLRPTTINNTTNNNTDNSTNINVIQYNNYDKPYTDHITNTVMKGIFETSQRDPALILNETVRRIYKNDKHPENNVIKMGEKTALSKVFKDGKEIWLPMDGVIQTVLSNTGEFCADRIRDCHEEGVIIGDRARYVWQLMEVLGTDDREDDCLNRSSYIQSVKSAFL